MRKGKHEEIWHIFSILSIQKLGFTFKIYTLSVTSNKIQFPIYTKNFSLLHKICVFKILF